jgi:hypothetical protein
VAFCESGDEIEVWVPFEAVLFPAEEPLPEAVAEADR